ncbi:MAG: glycosyltransferase family 2 protein, partial [Euryarchaeota archaeon]|nr:glycosyltransferase family 2 protein [Euryarchaeota archaeon]
GDGQHDPGEIPGLLEPISNDDADLVIGFRAFGQMPFYRRFGRAVLDGMTGAGGAVTDSQSGFRALNRKAVQLLAGTLKKDDFSIESEMMRRSHDLDLRMAEVQIQCRYGDFDTSAKNPVSHGFGVLGLGDLAHRREETAALYRGTRVCLMSCRGLLWDTAASGV